MATTKSDETAPSCKPSLDRWMRFDDATEARFEEQYRDERISHLKRTIYFGLILYVAYVISNIALMPDIIWESIFLRVVVILPVAMWLAYMVGRVSAPTREWLMTFGVIGAHALPVYLFYRTDAPLGLYMFGDLNLTLAYGNMLLGLRFRQGFLFTVVALGMTVVVIFTKQGLGPNLQVGFLFQIVAAGVFSLYANFLQERRRCEDFCTAQGAVFRAEAAEISSIELLEISKTDALTGLPNRRYLDEKLDQWFEDTSAISILMIDIDHFKLFNDTLGHPAGDDCLRKVASVLMLATRGGDIFSARFGGEEFTIAIRDIGELETARLASSIVKSIEALEISHPGRNDGVGVVTASIGVAFKPWGRSMTKVSVLSQADDALYRAKRRGRNCFEITSKIESPARSEPL